MNTESVASFLTDGCGRCDKYRTDACKVRAWPEELAALRALVRETELLETMKWGAPCYTLDGQNVLMLAPTREWVGISFFRGALLSDPTGRLEAPGPNSQAARVLKFTSLPQIEAEHEAVVAFVQEAIARHRAGEKVVFAQGALEVPDQLQRAIDADPAVGAAWDALTRGRRRSHVLHVAGAKREATRERRAAKCVTKILAGKGFLDR